MWGCPLGSPDCGLTPPPGPAPLRYRDPVFRYLAYSPHNCLEDPIFIPSSCASNVYGSAPDNAGNPVTLTLDLYQPATGLAGAAADTATQRPAIVLVHGGYFCKGGAGSYPLPTLINTYGRMGFVVVSINYRLLPYNQCCYAPTVQCTQAAFDAQHDAQAAVRWLRANASQYRIDTDRIAIAGFSAGALTSLLVGSRPEDPGDSGNPGYSSRVEAAVSYSGGLPANAFFDQGDAPTIFFHGTNDEVVPFRWAQSNACGLDAAGVPTVFEPLQGVNHRDVLYPQDVRDFVIAQTSYFLYDALDLANADQSGGSPPPVPQQSSPISHAPAASACAEPAQSGNPAKPKKSPRCHGHRATITMPAAANAGPLTGTPKADVIVGTSRNDRIIGGGGDDLVCAGGGSDTVKSGRGSDALYGEGGADTLMGRAGDDLLSGGASKDICAGGRGRNTDTGC